MTDKASFEIGQQVRVIEETSVFCGETGPVSATHPYRPTPDSPVYYMVDLPGGPVTMPFGARELESVEEGK
jgi:hypothetical protein